MSLNILFVQRLMVMYKCAVKVKCIVAHLIRAFGPELIPVFTRKCHKLSSRLLLVFSLELAVTIAIQ